MVDKVKEEAKDPAETVLLDVFLCGTETIGVICMKEDACGRVVKVDISIPAIDDAKINAELNGFTEVQTQSVASRAEHVPVGELKTLQGGTSSRVAVINPARERLYKDVARTLVSTKEFSALSTPVATPLGRWSRTRAGFYTLCPQKSMVLCRLLYHLLALWICFPWRITGKWY